MIAEYGRRLGASDLTLYLADYETRILVPVPGTGPGAAHQPASIDSTLAGRCFQRLDVEYAALPDGTARTWVPLLSGTERLGVLEAVTSTDHRPEREDVW